MPAGRLRFSRSSALVRVARIIYESVGRNEQTLAVPELRPLFSDHSKNPIVLKTERDPNRLLFALFRRHGARPCSGLRELFGVAIRTPAGCHVAEGFECLAVVAAGDDSGKPQHVDAVVVP